MQESGLIKFFLWYACQLSRVSILFFSILNSLRVHMGPASVADNLMAGSILLCILILEVLAPLVLGLRNTWFLIVLSSSSGHYWARLFSKRIIISCSALVIFLTFTIPNCWKFYEKIITADNTKYIITPTRLSENNADAFCIYSLDKPKETDAFNLK